MKTTIRSRTSFKFGKIRPGITELAAIERMEKFSYTYNGRNVVTTLVPLLNRIFFILAGNEENHRTSDEFEIRQDPTRDCGVELLLCIWKNPRRLIMGEML